MSTQQGELENYTANNATVSNGILSPDGEEGKLKRDELHQRPDLLRPALPV